MSLQFAAFIAHLLIMRAAHTQAASSQSSCAHPRQNSEANADSVQSSLSCGTVLGTNFVLPESDYRRMADSCGPAYCMSENQAQAPAMQYRQNAPGAGFALLPDAIRNMCRLRTIPAQFRSLARPALLKKIRQLKMRTAPVRAIMQSCGRQSCISSRITMQSQRCHAARILQMLRDLEALGAAAAQMHAY